MGSLGFSLIRRGVGVLVGALLMTWPALYNGYPLLYPDSMSYLEDGPLVARALAETAGESVSYSRSSCLQHCSHYRRSWSAVEHRF